LPPYIERAESPADENNYQTVYAAHAGAVAAPTAGLHFTSAILGAIRARGIEVVHLTLHVGIGTFLPIRSEIAEEHVLRPERFEVSAAAAATLREAQRGQRRIVAVGTTTTRTLEYLMREYGEIRAGAGKTDLYILPGFPFRITGALLTNFHLPRSTLLMLVSAFAGGEAIRQAYRHAIEQRYRFYSYGDCMLIEK
jgi:S-adenosylmethionine:tRNA ribosyltransferase-isomerase